MDFVQRNLKYIKMYVIKAIYLRLKCRIDWPSINTIRSALPLHLVCRPRAGGGAAVAAALMRAVCDRPTVCLFVAIPR